MNNLIHPTAIIDNNAELGENVVIGAYSVIEDNVVIGAGTEIKSHAVIASGARLGKNVKVFSGAVISSIPQDLKFEGEDSLVTIGDNTVIREYATINRGTKERGETTVGKGCLLMAYSHTAHDCLIGDDVIMANAVNLAGHVEIGDHAIIGGIVPVHQFVRIGVHAMVGGGFRVPMDICPFAMCAGYPLKVMGLNLIGLRRRKFSKEVIKTLENTFRILFKSGFNTSQAVEKIKQDVQIIAEVQLVLDFIEKSERGINK